MRSHLLTRLALGVAILGTGGLTAARAQLDETPKEIIAAHIRMQGYTCEKPVTAERDRSASRPDEAAWFLECENKTYRVRLIPDMAAEVRVMN